MEDEKIIDLFFERSESAISYLSESYGKICKTISYNITQNDMDAQECVNDTYLAVWNSIPPEKPDSLRAYVLKLVRNIAVMKYRSNTAQKRNSYYDQPIDEFVDCIKASGRIEENLEREELTATINAFLETLKPIDRAIFLERFWFCYEISEIMKNHDLSKNYVNVHLHRTKEKLRKYLEMEGFFK